MKILVTGAGGLLGSSIARDLIKRGLDVFHFSRSSYPHLQSLGVKQIQGDVGHKDQVEKAVQGMDAVFHTAALVDMWGKWEWFYQTNVIGTQNLLEACQRQGVSKFIYTSSPSVVFGRESLHGQGEELDYPKRHYGLYAKSKAMAERMVLLANKDKVFCTVSLRPHLIWGPEDRNLIPRLVARAREGKLKIVGDGLNKVDVTHVDNAAHAHLLAFDQLQPESPLCGQSYFIGQERPVVLWDFINRLLEIYQIPPIRKSIPASVAYYLGASLEKTYSALGLYRTWPPMTRFLALQLAKSHYFDHHKAYRDFGYVPKFSIEEGLSQLAESLKGKGKSSNLHCKEIIK